MPAQPAPRRFWYVTFFDTEGRRHGRYVKCPYLVETEDPESHGGRTYRRPLAPGDDDYPDTYLAMTARLGALEWDGIISSFRVTPVRPERLSSKCRQHPDGCIRSGLAVRWREIEANLVAA